MNRIKKRFAVPLVRGIMIAIVIAIISSVFFTVISVVLAAGLPWVFIYVGNIFSAEPPKPEVPYNEVYFELVYEKDGERIEIKDTFVIEHKGIDWDEAHGKYNVWNVQLQEGNARLIETSNNDYFIVLDTVTIPDAAVEEQEILIYLGNSEAYMGLNPSQNCLLERGLNVGDVILSGQLNAIYDPVALNEEELSKYHIEFVSLTIPKSLSN